MRKLNELLRSLARFLHDPAEHVTQAWKLVRAQVSTPAADPKLRDALVVIDNVVGAVSKPKEEEEKKTPKGPRVNVQNLYQNIDLRGEDPDRALSALITPIENLARRPTV